jgi:hypothetical protein
MSESVPQDLRKTKSEIVTVSPRRRPSCLAATQNKSGRAAATSTCDFAGEASEVMPLCRASSETTWLQSGSIPKKPTFIHRFSGKAFDNRRAIAEWKCAAKNQNKPKQALRGNIDRDNRHNGRTPEQSGRESAGPAHGNTENSGEGKGLF